MSQETTIEERINKSEQILKQLEEITQRLGLEFLLDKVKELKEILDMYHAYATFCEKIEKLIRIKIDYGGAINLYFVLSHNNVKYPVKREYEELKINAKTLYTEFRKFVQEIVIFEVIPEVLRDLSEKLINIIDVNAKINEINTKINEIKEELDC